MMKSRLPQPTKPSDASPPPTPDPEVPLDMKKWRFNIVEVICERSEDYRPGGYHPVVYGDKFCEGRYTVIRKLGYGSFSTVWLAMESRVNRYVALKILTAKASMCDTELEIIQSLSQKADTDTRSEHIVTLLDTFLLDGPNGKHRCLVFEPMGPSTAWMAQTSPEDLPDEPWRISKYPKSMAKKIILDALRGLAFLHENNIVHGNVQPKNLLFCIKDIAIKDRLKCDKTVVDKIDELVRLDGKKDKWAPKYLYLDVPLRHYAMLNPNTKVKLSGLSSAFRVGKDSPFDKDVSPMIALRAPEIILGKCFGAAIDIWALGCMLFEFLTDRPLFLVNQRKPQLTYDDHFLQFNDIIGELPKDIVEAWPCAEKWFNPVTREPLNKSRLHQDSPYDSLELLFAKNKSDEIDGTESAVICSLIRKMLTYSPTERPPATELLKHAWFLA